MTALMRDFLPSHLQPGLKAAGIEGTVAVQAEQTEEETRFLLGLAEDHPSIWGVVGWVDLADPKVGDRLAECRKSTLLCGFRHILQAEPDDRFVLGADFRRGICCLAAFDFTYDILIYPRHLPAVIELVAMYPQQRFVLDHLAKPQIRSAKLQPWARLMFELGTATNVFCKLSGLITEADWAHWAPGDFKPYLDVAFEAFGWQRLMFGSDWPVCLLAGTYAQVVELVSSYLRDRPRQEQTAIFGDNAARFYRLKARTDGLGTRQ